MTVVGVTGASGFLGWHVRCRLHLLGIKTVVASRETFASSDALDEFVQMSDVVIHTAGVNRSSDDNEIADGNPRLASDLVAALERAKSPAPIIYTNSTQRNNGTVYGEAKAAAGAILQSYCQATGQPFFDAILPHVFGEFGRENYNSAVTTFAHALATESVPEVNRAGELELVHAQDVAARFADFVVAPRSSVERFQGTAVTVGEVWDQLQRLHNRYVNECTIPLLDDKFELRIFNMLRSQLYRAGHYPVALTLHADHRGGFAELCRADGTGQTSISTSVPGVTRGDHFHVDKVERFVVVDGTATIRMRRILTSETHSFVVSGSEPAAIDMPPLVTHNISNDSDAVVTTAFWAGDHFDADSPDTYSDPVGMTV